MSSSNVEERNAHSQTQNPFETIDREIEKLDQQLNFSVRNTDYKESPELDNQESQKTRTEIDTINIANGERLQISKLHNANKPFTISVINL